MDPDAGSEPSQETNAYSFSKETDTNANAYSVEPAHTYADTNNNHESSAHAYADGNHAFPNSPANTDSDCEPYSEEANADAIPEKAHAGADWIGRS
jgi:hypothetical protein